MRTLSRRSSTLDIARGARQGSLGALAGAFAAAGERSRAPPAQPGRRVWLAERRA
jgi:hypothetical protein